MGGGENEITIDATLDADGFESGTEKMGDAIDSLGKAVEYLVRRIAEAMKELDVEGVAEDVEDAADQGREASERYYRGMEDGSKKSGEKLKNRFKKVFGEIKGIVKTFGSGIREMFGGAERGAKVAENGIKRFAGTLLGAAGVYQVLSKAVHAYMAQNQELSAKLNSIWTALGNVLGPIINQIVQWVTTAISYFLEFLRLLGITSKTASQLSKKANAAGSELRKTIAGFDELNLLQAGGGGGANGNLSDVDPVEWMNAFAEALKNRLWDDAADILIGKINEIISRFKEKAKGFGEYIGEWVSGIAHVLARLINDVDWKGIGEGIGSFFMGLTEELDGNDLGAIIVGKVKIAFEMVIGFLETEGLGARIAKLLSGIFTGAINSLTRMIGNAETEDIGRNIRQFFENIDWDGLAESVKELLHKMWEKAVDLLRGILKNEGDEEDPPLVKALVRLEEAVKSFGENAGPVLEGVWKNILQPFIEWLGSSAIPGIIEIFAALIDAIGNVIAWLGKIAPEATGAYTEMLAGLYGVEDEVYAMSDAVSESAEDIAKATEESANRLRSATTHYKEAFQEVTDASSETGEGFTEDAQGMTDTAETEWGDIERRTGDFGEKIKEVVSDSSNQMRDDFEDGLTEMGREASEQTQDMERVFEANFGVIANNAYWWGQDMMISLNNGIVAAFRDYVMPTVAQVAQYIRNFLGFSEPKEGPLSDFHTFGPDMMKLYADGIESNKGKVISAVNEVAQGISDAVDQDYAVGEFNISAIDGVLDRFGDKVVDGFQNLADRLQAIADNVIFTMPVVAGGSIMPYGVVGGGFSTGDEEKNETLAAIEELLNLVRDFERAVNNMQWVAEFGDLRLLVQKINKISKQTERATG